jgi:hypothetical protein
MKEWGKRLGSNYKDDAAKDELEKTVLQFDKAPQS